MADMSVRIESDTFAEFRRNMNDLLRTALIQMQEKDSDEASISARIDIKLMPELVDDPTMPYAGAQREIVCPKFNHKIKSVIQLKDDREGKDGGEGYELVWDQEVNKYYVKPIGPQQVSLFDTDDEPAFEEGDCDDADDGE